MQEQDATQPARAPLTQILSHPRPSSFSQGLCGGQSELSSPSTHEICATCMQEQDAVHPATAQRLLDVAQAKKGTAEETVALLAALLRAHSLRVRSVR